MGDVTLKFKCETKIIHTYHFYSCTASLLHSTHPSLVLRQSYKEKKEEKQVGVCLSRDRKTYSHYN